MSKKTKVERSLSCFLDPFCGSKADIKIPDGSLNTMSVPKEQIFNVPVPPVLVDEVGDVAMVMSPNRFTPVRWFKFDSNTGRFVYNTFAPVVSFPKEETLNDDVNGWRLVSEGLRFSYTGQSDDLQGAFTAFRMSSQYPAETSQIFPAYDMSVITDAVKNINKYTFNLNYSRGTNDYNFISNGVDVDKYDSIAIVFYNLHKKMNLMGHIVAFHEFQLNSNSSLLKFTTPMQLDLGRLRQTLKKKNKHTKAGAVIKRKSSRI